MDFFRFNRKYIVKASMTRQIVPVDNGEKSMPPPEYEEPLTCCGKLKRWCGKYLLEGQHLDQEAALALQSLPENPSLSELLFIKYRKFTGALMPFLFMHIFWWMTAIKHNFFQWYPEYWPMPLTMALGSFIGGMTSEGSGAVAFPVMTLALHIAPPIARDFSLMIQSCGMTSAMMATLFMKVKIEERAVILGTMGAIPGFIFGVYMVDPHFTGPQKKMAFVAIWTAFAFALMILNTQKRRETFKEIPDFKVWKAIVLVITGFVGGIFESFAGSGVDICVFSVTTLLFRVTEKTVTPTTVVLKGINCMFGFYWRAVMMGDINELAWKSFAISIPVSTTVGPLGSFLGSHLHRQVVAGFVYVLELIAVIGFLFSRPGWLLVGVGAAIIFGGFLFFSALSKAGAALMVRVNKKLEAERELEQEKEARALHNTVVAVA